MEPVVFSEVSYGQPTAPKLKIAHQSPRSDSLSSSRTQDSGDSGYISDPDISLSPLEFISPCQIPHTSSDFALDSSALFEVKEVASSRTKRLTTTYNPLQTKKHRIAQDRISTPSIEVRSAPKIVEDTVDNSQLYWTSAAKLQGEGSACNGDSQTRAKGNLHPQDHPKERNLSTVSLDSTGSCDMYSNTDDNSDDEHVAAASPGTLPKATLIMIEFIMRRIELNLAQAAYSQCAGGHASRAHVNTNSSRGSRSSQASSGKRKARSDEHLPPDDPDEDDANKRRRVSVTTTTEDSETGPRFACPFFKHDPNRYRNRRTCGGPGWVTVHRMKEHLYRSHTQPIFCPRCYAMFDSETDFSAHLRGNPCQVSAPQPIEGIDRRTFESLKKRTPTNRLEEDKWRDAYQLLFPDVASADIPSPYYDSGSPTEESRRFRRALLERVRTELFATAEREPGQVEQRLLWQVASIIRRCENDLLESFYAPAPNPNPSLPSSRRGSAIENHPNDPSPSHPRIPRNIPPNIPLPSDPHDPDRSGVFRDPGAPPPAPGPWDDPGFPYSWVDVNWEYAFPSGGLGLEAGERDERFMALNASIYTQ